MDNKIHIAYAPDDNYTNLTIVSMTSVVENNKDTNIEFIILYSKLEDKNIKKYEYFKNYPNCDVRFVKVNEELFDGLPLSHWVTVQAWFRVVIPTLCPDLDKVLYLDCDTSVNSSLKDLWNLDLGDNYLASVKDIVHTDEFITRLKMRSNSYFNSGVLLINCNKFREENVLDKIKEIVDKKSFKIKFCDQDTLNIIADVQKIDLPMKYNYMEIWWHNGYFEYFGEEEKLYLEARENPTIVHFTGVKPSKKGCKHSQRDNWWKYAKLSNIYDEILEDYNASVEKQKPERAFDKVFKKISEYDKNRKWRSYIIFGMKFRFEVSKNRKRGF